MMKKAGRIILTVVMVCVMLSVFAMPALAEPQNISDSGVTWELKDGNAVLEIGGEGAMPNFMSGRKDDRPWSAATGNITTVNIAPGVSTLGNYAFSRCAKLGSIIVPSGVTVIGESVFAYCTNLKSITLPSGVESIGKCAFYKCGFTSITIPFGVTGIGVSAFCLCENLENVTIPSSVTVIGDSAFNTCKKLKSITLPSGMESIGNEAFKLCNSLTNVTVKASAPPTMGAGALPSAVQNIFVPEGAGEKYKSADSWKDFAEKINEAYIVDDIPVANGTLIFSNDCFPISGFSAEGETVTVTVTPDDGYQLKSLMFIRNDGTEEQDITDQMSFTMPADNVTVTAEFELIEAVTASVLSQGNIWIVIAVAVLAVAGVAILFIVKKKKPASHSEK